MLFACLFIPLPQSFRFPTLLLSQPRGCRCEPRDAQGPAHLSPLKVRAKEMRPKFPLPFCSSLLFLLFLVVFPLFMLDFGPAAQRGATVPALPGSPGSAAAQLRSRSRVRSQGS